MITDPIALATTIAEKIQPFTKAGKSKGRVIRQKVRNHEPPLA